MKVTRSCLFKTDNCTVLYELFTIYNSFIDGAQRLFGVGRRPTVQQQMCSDMGRGLR
jgi:hypothetical protein